MKHYKSITRSFLRFSFHPPSPPARHISLRWWEAQPLAAKKRRKEKKSKQRCLSVSGLHMLNSYYLLNGCLSWIKEQLLMVHSFFSFIASGKSFIVFYWRHYKWSLLILWYSFSLILLYFLLPMPSFHTCCCAHHCISALITGGLYGYLNLQQSA